jgi:hypothetical protein
MLGRTQLEANRVGAIVVALAQEEITMDEFSEAVGSLTSESIQVMACLLRNWTDWSCEEQGRVGSARLVCNRLAAKSRMLS